MTDDLKDKIIEQTDIVEVIGEVVELRKRGANFIGLCPFHTEKTPSFTVSEERGFYNCFGCGKKGNVISFMMDYHGMSFPEALKELARKAGIVIPEYSKQKKQKQELSRKEIILNALEAANNHFVKLLNTNAGKIAVSYYNKRGFSYELIKEFHLGYSFDSWDSLLTELKKTGFSENDLHDAGLIIKNEEKNSYYDRFRGRAMFPIQNALGKVIGFGARQLGDDENQPKYINSPQTIVYDKSRSLYGLYQAKNELRSKKSAILVEGYADVLSLYQAGYKNVVASSGTALTKEQLEILSKYCKKLYMVYDADTAGIKAMERGLELALHQGFELYIVRLPAGEDPDSLIKNHGGKIFQVYLADAVSFIEFKAQLYKKQGVLDSPAGRAEAIRELIHLISSIPDRLQHDDYMSRLSMLLNLTEAQLKRIYKEKVDLENKNKHAKYKPVTHSDEAKPSNEANESNKDLQVNNKIIFEKIQKELLPEEFLLLNMAIYDSEAMKLMFNDFRISEKNFFTDEGKRLFLLLEKAVLSSKEPVNKLISDEEIPEDDRHFFTAIAFSNPEQSENWGKFTKGIKTKDINKPIKDILYRIEIKKIDEELKTLLGKTNKGYDVEQIKDLIRIKELTQVRNEILNTLQSG